MTALTDPLTAARAEALFASDLPTGSRPTRAEVTIAIRSALRIHGGVSGCAATLAGEYGDHPEIAVPRMRWALGVIRTVYAQHQGDALSEGRPTDADAITVVSKGATS